MNKKWGIALGLAVVMLAVTITVSASAKDDFSDIDENTRHYVHINALYEDGIIKGFTDQTFRPNSKIKRVDAAMMVFKALGLEPASVSSLTFEDVPERAQEEVAALVEAGIVEGYSSKKFGSNETITRAEVAKMITLAYELNTDVGDQGFTDIGQTAELDVYVNAIAAEGIAEGYPNGAFGVHDEVKRGDFAAILDRARDPVRVIDIS